jgi:hypothetical protein
VRNIPRYVHLVQLAGIPQPLENHKDVVALGALLCFDTSRDIHGPFLPVRVSTWQAADRSLRHGVKDLRSHGALRNRLGWA